MLETSVTYAVLPASDLQRAVGWYRDKLEWEPESNEEGAVRYRTATDSWILVYETSNAGTAKNTQLCWLVDDLEGTMDAMRGRGVTFEEYDFPGLKTENGIATDSSGRTAWFRDSEGNYLCLTQQS
ncbi:MAG TPA: VOC family protein [Leifsonia sp.]|jgi:predicted enzyme related to lactoylglutathione lyase